MVAIGHVDTEMKSTILFTISKQLNEYKLSKHKEGLYAQDYTTLIKIKI